MAPRDRVERRLAAILAADVVGYSRLMSQDEVRTLRTLTAHREAMDRLIADHGGRIANTAGDSVLAEFPSAVDAVQCAVEVQKALAELNSGADPEQALRFRIGVHVGDVMVQGADLLGDGVNIAARLEALAEPGGVCVSGPAYEYVRKALPLAFTDLGPQQVKNIEEPVRAYSAQVHAPPRELTTHQKPDPPKPLPLPDKPSLAVLPFTNMSGDPEQEYFADGIVEDIITALSRVKWFFVIARNSSFTYKGKAVDIRQVGRELGVRYVLEGSIRKAGNRVRITGQLIEAATGHHVWADRFDGSLENIFDLQDQITENVVGAIEPSLRVTEIQRAKAKPTESLDAYDLYLRALPEFYEVTRGGYERAIGLLKDALRLDPDFQPAKGLLVLTYVTRLSQGWSDADDKDNALALADEVLTRGRNDPTALLGAGFAIAAFRKDYKQGLRILEAASVLNPNSTQVLNLAGLVCCYMCEGDKAQGYFERAMRLSPVDPEMGFRLSGLGFALVIKGEYENALQVLDDAVGRLPNWTAAYRMQIWALVRLGRLEEARSVAARHLQIDPGFSISKGSAAVLSNPTLREDYYSALRTAGLPE
jgi:adenylate cyclase